MVNGVSLDGEFVSYVLEGVGSIGNEGCWEWARGRGANGYGAVTRNMKSYGVHRIVWMIFFGEIPSGMYICHHCDNPLCLRPSHLFLGSPADNTNDMLRKGRGGGALPNNTQARKLNKRQVVEIRKKYSSGKYTMAELAKEYPVGAGQIAKIVNRTSWSWLKEL